MPLVTTGAAGISNPHFRQRYLSQRPSLHL